MHEIAAVRPLVEHFGTQAVWDASLKVLGYPVILSACEDPADEVACIKRVERFLIIGK